jgi:hypothetical protein
MASDTELILLTQNLPGNWISYTPTWSGLSALGASTSAGQYRRAGNVVWAIGSLLWGAGSTLGSGAISATLPFTAATVAGAMGWTGIGRASPSSATPPAWSGTVIWVGSAATSASIFMLSSTNTWVNPGNVSNPLPWSSNTHAASMGFFVVYECA